LISFLSFLLSNSPTFSGILAVLVVFSGTLRMAQLFSRYRMFSALLLLISMFQQYLFIVEAYSTRILVSSFCRFYVKPVVSVGFLHSALSAHIGNNKVLQASNSADDDTNTVKRYDTISKRAIRQRWPSETALEAFKMYKQLYNSTIIPQKFVIEKESTSFPKHLWGMKLGQIWTNMKFHESLPDIKDSMLELGYDYRPVYENLKHKPVLEAFTIYA
jgi:uncharacterized membrane protein